jgi:hypothetical protein
MAAKASLGPVIAARNLASGAAFGANSGPEAKRVLAAARKRVNRAVQMAKQSWMDLVVARIEGRESAGDRRPVTPKEI